MTEIEDELAAANGNSVAEAEVVSALGDFCGVWDSFLVRAGTHD